MFKCNLTVVIAGSKAKYVRLEVIIIFINFLIVFSVD